MKLTDKAIRAAVKKLEDVGVINPFPWLTHQRGINPFTSYPMPEYWAELWDQTLEDYDGYGINGLEW